MEIEFWEIAVQQRMIYNTALFLKPFSKKNDKSDVNLT